MRFLADEGVDAALVSAIRSEGHDVRWMAEDLAGVTDDVVLDAAARDARILITEDKDFGELVFRQRLHHRGVVLVRVDGIANERKGRIVAQAIGEYQAQLAGAFTVIQHATIRIRGA
jgi:predicted nuclease of predicted toxin-antitoxin system